MQRQKVTELNREKYHRCHGRDCGGPCCVESGWGKDRHLSGSHPAGETPEVGSHHRLRRHRRGVCHRLEFLRRGCDHCRNAAAPWFPLEDEEVSKELEKEFEKRGIKCLVGTKVESVEATKTGVKVEDLRRRQGNDAGGRAGFGLRLASAQFQGLWARRGRASRSATAALSRSMKRCRPMFRISGPSAM